MAVTILLVDDHPLFRKGLRLLLEEQADFLIVGEAENGREAIEQVRKLSPDVVLMDITMPDFDGIEATRQIFSEVPSAKVVALSMHAGKRFVENMLRAGATGYILKKSVPEDLVNGIRMVIQGQIYLSPAITGLVVSEYKELIEKSSSVAQANDALPILHTKFYRPKLSPDLVPRLDLVERMDELRSRTLTLVSSAAGYGKSTLASLWLEAWDGPYGWLSLDKNENDLYQFVNHFLAAIRRSIPEACDTTQSLLQGPKLPPVSILSRHLVNDLDAVVEPFIMVLDDFHVIREKAVHELIGNLLKYPPQNVHLILLTRSDPPLLTSTLRSLDQVNEIGSSDLTFTVEETAVFLKNALGFTVDGKTAAIIREKLEGWPAGIRLMVNTLKNSRDLDSLMAGLKGGFPVIRDYLMMEVLSQQTPGMARMMVATSVLDRFSASLVDALQGLDAPTSEAELNGDEFIARLQKSNLFLIPLDRENRWFRYHHLFRQLLLNQLDRLWSQEKIAALRTRAKIWLAENDTSDGDTRDFPAVFRYDELNTMPDPTGVKSTSSRLPNSQSLVDPLTNREIDVIHLLSERLSNKEIAERLFISITTVKGHLQNIYQKLDVNKRREAVDEAKRLGIL